LNYLRLTLLGTAVAFLIVSPGALAGTSHGDNGSPSKFRSEAAIGEQFVPLSVVPNLSLPKLDKRCAGHGNGLIYPQLFFDGSNGEACCAWDETVYFKEDADDWLRSQGY